MAKEIQCPLPGIFYRKPAPEEPPFVEDGGAVEAGAVIGLVEVMKSFHEVTAEEAGENIRFEVENEGQVTAGAVLARMD
ncbi:Biotin carboxyl carrier protein of acetyl-CoA carboxylase [Roseivivax jejudonensis]|uniref:Biotin carboxyl carrier protein of acetyl-CoA carboxylase n=1 Tax=Roseivivax jejudonensis TaxID=1529041 RepID=A0A1X6Y3P9_9RHOB|nr:acetyl-CoA carboxylase [Roseivivax jejudonensis]SLN09821.1 Biotin carboxyl carrier protein of acetyl-CoA carboxylase [Roseivivax jejudonensis]